MTEADLQRGVIELARLLGYRVAHFRPAKTDQGWRTPVEADGKGFPDLVIAGRGSVLFVELKGDRGTVSAEQRLWIDALQLARADVFVWTPAEWSSGEIERILRSNSRSVLVDFP